MHTFYLLGSCYRLRDCFLVLLFFLLAKNHCHVQRSRQGRAPFHAQATYMDGGDAIYLLPDTGSSSQHQDSQDTATSAGGGQLSSDPVFETAASCPGMCTVFFCARFNLLCELILHQRYIHVYIYMQYPPGWVGHTPGWDTHRAGTHTGLGYPSGWGTHRAGAGTVGPCLTSTREARRLIASLPTLFRSLGWGTGIVALPLHPPPPPPPGWGPRRSGMAAMLSSSSSSLQVGIESTLVAVTVWSRRTLARVASWHQQMQDRPDPQT